MRSAFLLMLAALNGPAWTAAPISKAEIRAASDARAKQLVMAQLSDLLVLDGYKGSKEHPPKHPLSDIWLSTRPHGTATRGVCVNTTVVIRFRATEEGPRDADTPVRASDIETFAYYRLLAPIEPKDLDRLDADAQVRADRRCAAIEVRSGMIAAPDEETLVMGLWLLRKAKAALAARESVAVDCEGFKQSCDAVLAGIDPAKIESVETCPATGRSRCYVVEDGGTSAELQVDPDDRVTSVKLDQEIVVADLRED
jgi:hypothetical protein